MKMTGDAGPPERISRTYLHIYVESQWTERERRGWGKKSVESATGHDVVVVVTAVVVVVESDGRIARQSSDGRGKIVVGRAARGNWWGHGWRHGMPWYRLPACNGRESGDDLRPSITATSSDGATNSTCLTGGHYDPTIGWVHGTTRIRRRFKYGFFSWPRNRGDRVV